MNKGAVIVSVALWLAMAVAIWDRVANHNASAETGIWGTGVSALFWTWIAWDLRRNHG